MRRKTSSFLRLTIAALVLLLVAGAIAGSGSGISLASAPLRAGALWQDANEANIAYRGTRDIVPARYRVVTLDEATLSAVLATAPAETELTKARNSTAVIGLPLPDGSISRFSFVDSPVMEPELAARFPMIKTYLGQGIDDKTAVVRFDRTQVGFHAMILSANGAVFIDPYQRGDTTTYISYYKSDFLGTSDDTMLELGVKDNLNPPGPVSAPVTTGPQLRTYRLAMAATGEYTQFHGGTVPLGMAAITTSVNRVTGVYEQEAAVRLVLVANNNLLVYTNGATDPYTNNDGFAMLGQNQTNVDTVIGSANYDIGHVFSTGGGGVAGLGVVCIAGQKAQGVTGSGSPVGDPFDIDYVAHEVGHQYDGNHSFNGTTGACGGGNRNGPTAWEPGSGSTIMAYAGICGAENLQPHSDPFFHIGNIDEIVSFTTTGQGNTCAVVSNTGNQAPVANAGPDYTIPINTPFRLTGSATDPDGDTLTYMWEEFDHGSAAPPNTDNGNRAIFRSFPAVTVPYRFFPRLSDILSGAPTPTFGEAWPTTNRTMVFRFSVRDGRAGGGGLDDDSASITSTTSAGPFAVTSPNTAVTWTGGGSETITWDVANTTAAPVSCANVDLLLSTDGGATFPIVIAGGTPNDGSQLITVPNNATTQARVMAICSNNVFLDISNSNFTIEGGPTATPTTEPTATSTVPPGSTPTPCTLSFTDVPSGSTFYEFIRCLSCRGIISGYSDNTFRPNNNVTRGQLAKIVANAADFTEPAKGQQFEDVPLGSTFYDFIWRLTVRGIVSGYPCGGPGEPCGGGNLPYYRPNANVTRGQISKIVSEAAGYSDTPGGQQFEDVAPGSTFYDWIWRLADRSIMSGYPCGGPGEPCGGGNLPYFRPGSPATRGQASKIVSNTFFPGCVTPR